MGMFDALGSVANSAFAWFGAEQQNRRQADAAERANAFSAQQFATRYQTTVSDMKSAGLNPMLAYSQGGGSPPSGQQANVPANSLGAASSAYRASEINQAQVELLRKQGDNVDADSNLKRANAQLVEAQIGATGASADQSRASISFMEQQGRKIGEEVKNIPKEGDRLVALVKQLDATSKLLASQNLTEEQRKVQMEHLARKTFNEADLGMLDVQAAMKFDNFGREFQQYKPIIDLLKSVIGRR